MSLQAEQAVLQFYVPQLIVQPPYLFNFSLVPICSCRYDRLKAPLIGQFSAQFWSLCGGIWSDKACHSYYRQYLTWTHCSRFCDNRLLLHSRQHSHSKWEALYYENTVEFCSSTEH